MLRGRPEETPLTALASVDIHEGTFLAIVVASAIAGTISAVAAGPGAGAAGGRP